MKTKTNVFPIKLFLMIVILFTIFESNAQDVIRLNNGDSIVCKITKITSDTIYMNKLYKENTINTYIDFSKVKDYYIYTIKKLEQDNDTSLYYSLYLNDGNRLSGKVLSYDNAKIKFYDNNLGELTIDAVSVVKIENEELDVYYLIKLVDGNEFYGKIIKRRKTDFDFETKTMGIVTIQNSKIKKMQIVEEGKMSGGKYWFPNPNNTRYFFAPSAFNLKEGEAYYQNVYILSNSANYGVTNNFSIGGGIIIPFAIYITPKVNFKITEKLYVGTGGIFGVIPGPEVIGIAYAIATYGTNEHNVTLGTGYGFYDSEFANRPIITLNGMTRISRKVALVTENWSIPFTRTEYDDMNWQNPPVLKKVYDTYFSYGLRIMGEKITIDIAFVNSKDIFEIMPIGVPYVDFVYKF